MSQPDTLPYIKVETYRVTYPDGAARVSPDEHDLILVGFSWETNRTAIIVSRMADGNVTSAWDTGMADCGKIWRWLKMDKNKL